MLLNKKRLESMGACKDAIKFLDNNKLLPLNLDKIKVTGDYNNYYLWINDFREIKFDSNDNCTYIEHSNDNWFKYEYDNNNNLIYRENYNGYWVKYEYDNNNNCIYEEYSTGYWVKYKYDNNNCIYEEDSKGFKEYHEFIKNDNSFIIKRNNKNICTIDFLK